MPTCIEYMREKLVNNQQEYVIKHQAKNDLFVQRIGFAHQYETVWVYHAEVPIKPEDIRRCFDFKGHLLFIVDEALIPDTITDRESTPEWLRVLHGLYMGRVYVWGKRGVYGVHFNWDTGTIDESPYIPITDLRCQENATWVRGWPGNYRLAYLRDWTWWTDNPPRHQYTYNANGGQYGSNTHAREGWKYDPNSGFVYHEKDWPGGKPPAPPKPADYFGQFAACQDAKARRVLWMTLLKQHHPDTLGVDAPQADIDRATKITQEINQAYQKAERVL